MLINIDPIFNAKKILLILASASVFYRHTALRLHKTGK